jgi:hypothetical protein
MFCKFTKLPPELQANIWDIAAVADHTGVHVLHLDCRKPHLYTSRADCAELKLRKEEPARYLGSCGMWTACKESRTAMNRAFTGPGVAEHTGARSSVSSRPAPYEPHRFGTTTHVSAAAFFGIDKLNQFFTFRRSDLICVTGFQPSQSVFDVTLACSRGLRHFAIQGRAALPGYWALSELPRVPRGFCVLDLEEYRSMTQTKGYEFVRLYHLAAITPAQVRQIYAGVWQLNVKRGGIYGVVHQ